MPYRYADEAITKKGRMALPWIGMKKSSRDPRSGKLAGRFSGTPEEIWIERRDGVAPFDARRDSSGRLSPPGSTVGGSAGLVATGRGPDFRSKDRGNLSPDSPSAPSIAPEF